MLQRQYYYRYIMKKNDMLKLLHSRKERNKRKFVFLDVFVIYSKNMGVGCVYTCDEKFRVYNYYCYIDTECFELKYY